MQFLEDGKTMRKCREIGIAIYYYRLLNLLRANLPAQGRWERKFASQSKIINLCKNVLFISIQQYSHKYFWSGFSTNLRSLGLEISCARTRKESASCVSRVCFNSFSTLIFGYPAVSSAGLMFFVGFNLYFSNRIQYNVGQSIQQKWQEYPKLTWQEPLFQISDRFFILFYFIFHNNCPDTTRLLTYSKLKLSWARLAERGEPAVEQPSLYTVNKRYLVMLTTGNCLPKPADNSANQPSTAIWII